MTRPLRQAEQALAKHTGRGHAVLTGNGTTAIWVVLSALDLHEGSAVLYPDLTCETAVNAAIFAGLAPVFADVRTETAVPTPADLATAATATRAYAMVPTHIFGLCGPLPADLAHCPQIVDAAQGTVDARATAGGLAAIVSFGPGKQFDLGGGGAVLTDDPSLARECRALMCTVAGDRDRATVARDNLMRDLVALGREARANPLDCARAREALLRHHRRGYLAPAEPDLPARLLAALADRPERTRRRETRARLLTDALGRLPGVRLLELGDHDVPWRVSFTVPATARNAVLQALAALGFAPSRLFAPAHRLVGLPDLEFPRATRLAEALVNLDPDRLGDDPAAAADRAATAVGAALVDPARKEQHART